MHGLGLFVLARLSVSMRVVVLFAATLLSACTPGSSASTTESLSPQERFDQAVAQSEGVAVSASVSQNRCIDGELTITSQTRLERPDDGELYIVMTTGCTQGTVIGPETAEVIHWWLGRWDSVGTIGMSKINWNVTGECRAEGSTLVLCPVAVPPNPTRPSEATLRVELANGGFKADIVY